MAAVPPDETPVFPQAGSGKKGVQAQQEAAVPCMISHTLSQIYPH